jgi:nucleotidyltransferase/DNA polymerase involved in DNA repair
MDAFYAAIEQRDRPELRGRPVIVGADPQGGRGRGVVSTASYEARPFGVRSAMPISQAYRLCPKGVYLPVDMERYLEVSGQVMGILRRFTDLVEPLSIDEAFLDVTQERRRLGGGTDVAVAIKAAIVKETRLTASVGVASSKLVAKIASDIRKPDGLTVVPPGGESAFLDPLPVRRLWGVGPKTEESLALLGIHTIGDLARADPGRLARRVGTHGHDLVTLARGLDARPVVPDGGEAKSIGQEHTYAEDTRDPERLRRTLLRLADGVARRLRSHGLKARTVTLKYRDETFRTLTRAEMLREPTDSGNELFATLWRLFLGVHGSKSVRLVGAYASGFGENVQGSLFPPAPSPADQVRDVLNERFGKNAITRASLLSPRPGGNGGGKASRPTRPGDD